MAEYISREAAMLEIDAADFVIDANFEGGATLLYCDDVVDRLSAIPAADVRPVVRGKWINQRADSEMCSACGVRFYISALFAVGVNDEPNFCPNCGADMRAEEGE